MEEKVLPAFKNNNIPVVFSSNMAFAPIMAATIQSIIDNSASENNYDIIILSVDIHGSYTELLESMAETHTNFSIRILDVSKFIEGNSFYNENRADIAIETYLRLLLPDILKNYSKVLYLDGEMIVNTDIAELYSTDLDGYFLASTRDADKIGRYHSPLNDPRKDYSDNVLKLKNPDNYFRAGILVMNLDMFRKELPAQKLLDFAISYQWQYQDRDVLNVLCEGKVKLVDMAWDVLRDAGNNQYMPQEFYEEFLNSEINPKIIHYSGKRMPWKYFDVERGEYFWRYATRTPFYKQVLAMVSATNSKRAVTPAVTPAVTNTNTPKKNNGSKNDKQITNQMLKQFEEGKLGPKYLWKCFKAWLKYKTKRKSQK